MHTGVRTPERKTERKKERKKGSSATRASSITREKKKKKRRRAVLYRTVHEYRILISCIQASSKKGVGVYDCPKTEGWGV